MTLPASFSIRERAAGDEAWIVPALRSAWGSTVVVSRGRSHDARHLPGLVAEHEGRPAGLLTYRIDEGEMEIVTLQALERRAGVGRELIEAAREIARGAACGRVWAVTTNDNLVAIAFYRHVGWRLAAIHREAVLAARAIKAEIPAIGENGIPIEDEWEFEIVEAGP